MSMPNPAEEGKGAAAYREAAPIDPSGSQRMAPRSTGEAILVPMWSGTHQEGAIRAALCALAPQAAGRRVYLLFGQPAAAAGEAREAAKALGLDLAVLSMLGDLSSAVRHGIEEIGEDRLAVLDGSGRQDPRVLDALFAVLRSGIDLAVASRMVPGAVVPARPRGRWMASALACFAVRLSIPCRGVRDPLSGCFALRRAAWLRVAARVETGGTRFLVDLLPAAAGLQIEEVPVVLRGHGPDGPVLAAGWQLLVSIIRGALPLRLPRRWLSFAGVGALGTVTDAVLTGVCIGLGGLPFGGARTIGLAVGMTQNYLLNNHLTFAEVRGAATLRGWALFGICQTLGAVANWGVSVTAYLAGAPWFGALLLGTVAGMALNFATASKLVWPSKTVATGKQRSGPGRPSRAGLRVLRSPPTPTDRP